MGLRPTYMDETHLESMSFDGVGHDPPGTHEAMMVFQMVRSLMLPIGTQTSILVPSIGRE